MKKPEIAGRIVVLNDDHGIYAPCSPREQLKEYTFYRVVEKMDRFGCFILDNAETGERIPGSFCSQWFDDATDAQKDTLKNRLEAASLSIV